MEEKEMPPKGTGKSPVVNEVLEKFIKKFRPKKDKNMPQDLEDLRDYIISGREVERWLKSLKINNL